MFFPTLLGLGYLLVPSLEVIVAVWKSMLYSYNLSMLLVLLSLKALELDFGLLLAWFPSKLNCF